MRTYISQYEILPANLSVAGINWLVPVLLSSVLVASGFYHFPLFHILAEFFAIVIAVIMAVVSWQMYPFTRNNYLMYLGCGFFWVAALDVVHAFTLNGMDIFPVTGGNQTIQFWISASYFEAFLLLSAPYFLDRRFNIKGVFWFFGALFLLLLGLIIFGLFPACYTNEAGPTWFKVVSEYVIIVVLIFAGYNLWKRRALLEKKIMELMLCSIGLSVLSELLFTLYSDYHGFLSMTGHILKLFSFWLIFEAVISTTLRKPFLALARGVSAYDAVSDAIVMVDKDCLIRRVNKSAIEIADMSEETLMGMHIHPVFHPQNISVAECPVCIQIIRGEGLEAMELEFAEDGTWFDFTLSPIIGVFEHMGTAHVMRNITGRKRAEQELHKSQRRFKTLVEQAGDAFYLYDSNGWIKDVNNAACNSLGYARDECLRMNLEDLVVDYDYEVVSSIWKNLKPGEPVIYEGFLRRKDGSTFLVEVTIGTVEADDQQLILGLARDVSMKKEAEEQAIIHRQQLVMADKMTSLGTLVAGVAHEVNNPNNLIMCSSPVLGRAWKDIVPILDEYCEHNGSFALSGMPYEKARERLPEIIASIGEGSLRIDSIVRKLRVFSGPSMAFKRELDINVIVKSAIELITSSVAYYTNSFSVKLYDNGIPKIMGNNLELEQVVMNLIINACQALSGKEKGVTVFTGYDEEVKRVWIKIKDDGVGISKDDMDKITDPFFTTKQEMGGTGLGLAISWGIIKDHNGTLAFSSEVGQGTTAVINLPALNGALKL